MNTTFTVSDSLDEAETQEGSLSQLSIRSSNNQSDADNHEYFNVPEQDIEDYKVAGEKVDLFMNNCQAKTLEEWQAALEIYLTGLEADRKREIEEARREAEILEAALIAARNARAKSADPDAEQKKKKYENATAELQDLYEQYKCSRNNLESMHDQHQRYLEKEAAFTEKTGEFIKSDERCRAVYQDCADRYSALVEHLNSLVEEGDATVTAMIERHKTATIDARTKEKYLDLKKRGLEKKQSELSAEVNELMEMIEKILEARAGNGPAPDYDNQDQ